MASSTRIEVGSSGQFADVDFSSSAVATRGAAMLMGTADWVCSVDTEQ